MSSETKSAKAAPVARVKVRTVQGAIWARVTDKGTFFEATFQNRYLNRDGEWKNGQSYNLDNLLALQHAVGQAIDKVLELKAADASDTPEAPALETVDEEVQF
jgi:hypothetical protein